MPLRRSSAGPVGPASAPRAAAADPFAHAVLRSSAATGPETHWCARVPVIRGQRRHGSCVVSIHRRRRSATRCRIAWPGRDATLRPGGAHGVHPFAVLLLPARLRGRCPPCRIPLAVLRPVCPDNFRRGISRATQTRSRSCHPLVFGRQPIEDVRRGFWVWFSSRAIRAVVARVLWRAPRVGLAAAATALGFASLRCSGRCRAARTGSTPFRAVSLRKSASGSYPLVGLRLRLGVRSFPDEP